MGKASKLQSVPKVTFEVTDDQRALMDAHPEVNWSAVFRIAIERHARASAIAAEIVAEESDPRLQAVAAGLKQGVGARWRHARGD